jgi:tetratricopeptide (TPR) repeat protein
VLTTTPLSFRRQFIRQKNRLSTSGQLKFISLRAPLLRVLLLAPVALAMIGAWHALRWYIGNTMAPYALEAEDEGAISIARAAARLAPDDPQTYWSIAEVEKRGFTSEELNRAVKEYEVAVSRSPNDYRLWMDLGRAREQAGDAAGGEEALRRAAALAPSYALPHWYLGNTLVREGKRDEGLAELAFAGTQDPTLRGTIFDLAWRLYDGDIRAINEKFGNSAPARAQLTTYLVTRNRLEDALRLWEGLTPAEKRDAAQTGEALMNALFQAKHYHTAVNVYAAFAQPNALLPQLDEIQNGGFESDISFVRNAPNPNAFGWQIQPVLQAQTALDARIRRSGERSLRVIFNALNNVTFNNISQLVLVEPATHYRLLFSVRTKDLRSAGTPVLEVVSASDGSVIGASKPLALGTSDWQQIEIDFTTGAQTEAITLRTNRASCATEDAVCPIFGTVWYDDFNLQRLGAGGSSAQRKRSG